MSIYAAVNRLVYEGGVSINYSCGTNELVDRTVETYSNTIYRVALHYLKNKEDAEDVVHDVFLKWMEKAPVFEDESHEKAWFIRVTVNSCKDLFKSAWRSKTVDLDEYQEIPYQQPFSMLDDVKALPPDYSTVIYLHYYEGYTMAEIAQILHKTKRSVEALLYRARIELRHRLEVVNDA